MKILLLVSIAAASLLAPTDATTILTNGQTIDHDGNCHGDNQSARYVLNLLLNGADVGTNYMQEYRSELGLPFIPADEVEVVTDESVCAYFNTQIAGSYDRSVRQRFYFQARDYYFIQYIYAEALGAVIGGQALTIIVNKQFEVLYYAYH